MPLSSGSVLGEKKDLFFTRDLVRFSKKYSQIVEKNISLLISYKIQN